MEDAARRAFLERVKKKYGRRKIIKSKYVPKYDMQNEREYLRAVNAYMAILNTATLDMLNELKQVQESVEAWEAEQAERMDARKGGKPKKAPKRKKPVKPRSKAEAEQDIHDIVMRKAAEIERKSSRYNLSGKVKKIADSAAKRQTSEFKKAAQKTFGIDLFEDAAQGEKWEALLGEWVSTNTSLITSVPLSAYQQMENIIFDGWYQGLRYEEIAKDILHTFDVSRSRARFIARDQISKINGTINRAQQEDAGVTRYMWSTSGDERVRPYHKKLDGKIFSWDDPPVVDANGRRAHPSGDYQCRCVAIPVFDVDTLNLPPMNITKE